MKLTEGGKLERPNVCFLCERTPDIGSKVVDTERYFDGHPYTLNGRRYVCERCINDMLVFFDKADLATVERAEAAEMEARMIIRGIKLRLDGLLADVKHLAENPSIFVEEVNANGRTGMGVTANEQSGIPAFRGAEVDQSAVKAGTTVGPGTYTGPKG